MDETRRRFLTAAGAAGTAGLLPGTSSGEVRTQMPEASPAGAKGGPADLVLRNGKVITVDAAFTTAMHGGQPRSQPVDGRQPAPHLDEPDDQAEERENRNARYVQEEVVKHPRRARVPVNDLRHDHAEHSKQPRRPEHCSEHDARAKREARHHLLSSAMR